MQLDRMTLARPLLLSLQFLTRIPIEVRVTPSESELKKAAALYPLVGFVLAWGALGTYYCAALLLPHSVAVLLLIGFLIVITGALHEDGLADCADAFGAGQDREMTLEILRDSRIGTYGALALILVLLMKFLLLQELRGWEFVRCVIVAQTLSRWFALPLTLAMPQVRTDGLGSAFSRQVSMWGMVVSGIFTIGVGVLMYETSFLLLLAVSGAAVSLFAFYCFRRIGGISGDGLGAGIQTGEIFVYLSAVGLRSWT